MSNVKPARDESEQAARERMARDAEQLAEYWDIAAARQTTAEARQLCRNFAVMDRARAKTLRRNSP